MTPRSIETARITGRQTHLPPTDLVNGKTGAHEAE
jgi:hypothetical protein